MIDLLLGARINYIFNDVYGAYINSINNLANLTDEQIQVKKLFHLFYFYFYSVG